MEFTGLILAGGLATRMDGEKPLRVLHGKTLLQHAIDLMRPFVHEVIVCSGQREFTLPTGVTQTKDDPRWATKGPLAGVLAGLEHATSQRALLLPCDVPFLGAGVIRHLRDTLQTAPCAFITHDGHPQPLMAGTVREVAIPVIRQSLEAERFRVTPIWKQLGATELALSVGDGVLGSEREFLNINTLAEFNAETGDA